MLMISFLNFIALIIIIVFVCKICIFESKTKSNICKEKNGNLSRVFIYGIITTILFILGIISVVNCNSSGKLYFANHYTFDYDYNVSGKSGSGYIISGYGIKYSYDISFAKNKRYLVQAKKTEYYCGSKVYCSYSDRKEIEEETYSFFGLYEIQDNLVILKTKGLQFEPDEESTLFELSTFGLKDINFEEKVSINKYVYRSNVMLYILFLFNFIIMFHFYKNTRYYFMIRKHKQNFVKEVQLRVKTLNGTINAYTHQLKQSQIKKDVENKNVTNNSLVTNIERLSISDVELDEIIKTNSDRKIIPDEKKECPICLSLVDEKSSFCDKCGYEF